MTGRGVLAARVGRAKGLGQCDAVGCKRMAQHRRIHADVLKTWTASFTLSVDGRTCYRNVRAARGSARSRRRVTARGCQASAALLVGMSWVRVLRGVLPSRGQCTAASAVHGDPTVCVAAGHPALGAGVVVGRDLSDLNIMFIECRGSRQVRNAGTSYIREGGECADEDQNAEHYDGVANRYAAQAEHQPPREAIRRGVRNSCVV